MNIKEQKKGISLIVLVITIIVMIILAAAIILSLDGSNIIERAKGARNSNDVATAKEIVSLAKSEWSFKKPEGYDTFKEYAESKLEEAGFDMDNTYVENSGRVLFDTAARFAKAGVQLGDEVQGYTLNNIETYTTSGKENTCSSYNSETDPQPMNLKRDNNIKWNYIGINEKGEVLIAGSITDSYTGMRIGGKSGYINGPAELDKICDTMYSSSMGKARSINIDDITRILEYTGEEASYYNVNSEYIPAPKEKTINQIAKEIGYDMKNFSVQTVEEGKEIGIYKSDYYNILKNSKEDKKQYNFANAVAKRLVYPIMDIDALLLTPYWLASSCVCADFQLNFAGFCVRVVYNTVVDADFLFESSGNSYAEINAVRPVIQLAPDVDVSYNGTTVTIK